MGSGAFTYADGIDYSPGECILEVGSERGEGSTAYLARLADEHGIPFYSIDIDPDAAGRMRGLKVEFLAGRGEDVLAAWGERPRPRFVWADGHDWPYSWHLQSEGPHHQAYLEQDAFYARWGSEITERASEESHLSIARCLYDLMSTGGVVTFDDTWSTGERWRGKGGTAVPFLLETGVWTLVHATTHIEPVDGYVILERV